MVLEPIKTNSQSVSESPVISNLQMQEWNVICIWKTAARGGLGIWSDPPTLPVVVKVPLRLSED